MKIKICGMREPDNIKEVVNLQPDFIGFIFYSKSKRYVGKDFSPGNTNLVPKPIKKVGVFVNEPVKNVLEMCKIHQLDLVQLHGGESADYCNALKKNGIKIMKVFGVDNSLPNQKIEQFQHVADMYLFDTKTPDYGGSGKKFNWEVIEKLHPGKPIMISGGIGPDDAELLKSVEHPDFYGVDVNSKFEHHPAHKNTTLLKAFMNKIQSEK